MQEAAVVDPPCVLASGPERWRNRLLDLGDAFYRRTFAEALPEPHWVSISSACAAELDFPADWADRPGWRSLQVMSGGALWPGMAPLATVYGGHRSGAWAGPLGDRRTVWLGELDPPCGPRELQLKGAGCTPFSHPGDDGRLGLRSALREFLGSEALHALGVPTSRALCVTGSALPSTGDPAETAAMVARVAPSFIRFGHFEHFKSQADGPALQALADFVIDEYAPDCRGAPDPAAALLELTAFRTAELVASWQSVGFCHGLMDTDNMSILGLTIDLGASGFLDRFDPNHACNRSNETGRYAWGRQPQVALWNLHALAQAMSPLIGNERAVAAALETYSARFPVALAERFAAKLGLASMEADDATLVDDLLHLMAANGADFTRTFRRLSGFKTRPRARNAAIRDLFVDRRGFDAWALRYAERLAREEASDAERAAGMDQVNPKFVLRDHLVDVAVRAAASGDFSEVQRLHAVLQHPFDEQPQAGPYAESPPVRAEHSEV
jgi:uncharacterized protein YdiU (UPF0061 family)